MDLWLKIFLAGAALGALLGFLIEYGFFRIVYKDRSED